MLDEVAEPPVTDGSVVVVGLPVIAGADPTGVVDAIGDVVVNDAGLADAELQVHDPTVCVFECVSSLKIRNPRAKI